MLSTALIMLLHGHGKLLSKCPNDYMSRVFMRLSKMHDRDRFWENDDNGAIRR